MATWLITGAGGWLGSRVVDRLSERLTSNDQLVVLGRNRPQSPRGSLFVSADLHDVEGLSRAVAEVVPDYVVHAAGKTPPSSDAAMYETNFWGTDRLLGALHRLNRPVRVVVVGSAAEYGTVPASALPISEDQPLRPMTAYGRSKMMATTSALSRRGKLEVLVGRVFNLIGPGMPESLAFGRFAAHLAADGEPSILRAGRLDSRRDFVDVRDAACALLDLAERGEAGRPYNIGSGTSRSIQEGLDLLIEASGRPVQIDVDPDHAAARRDAPDDSVACIDRITAEIGWRPTTSFERSMDELWAAASRLAPAPLPLTA